MIFALNSIVWQSDDVTSTYFFLSDYSYLLRLSGRFFSGGRMGGVDTGREKNFVSGSLSTREAVSTCGEWKRSG